MRKGGELRGSAADRRTRKAWLIETFRANHDFPDFLAENAGRTAIHQGINRGFGEPACRCYRCGVLLTIDMLTVDRIVPGCKGGTYRRNNIRPACSPCQTETGNALKAELRRAAA